MLRLAQAHDADVPAQIRVVNDQFGCPTYAGDLAQVIVDMVSAGGAPAGLLHYCGADTVSWHDFAQRIFHCASTLDDSFCMPQVQDRKSVVSGKSVSVRVDLGGRRIIKKKNKKRK